MLNIFQGGPQHNRLIETHDLIHDRELDVVRWITDYAWTPEKIIGSVSGREARVWRFKESSTD